MFPAVHGIILSFSLCPLPLLLSDWGEEEKWEEEGLETKKAMLNCQLTSSPKPVFQLQTSGFFPVTESLLMGPKSLWEFWLEGLRTHQAGSVWSSLVFQIPKLLVLSTMQRHREKSPPGQFCQGLIPEFAHSIRAWLCAPADEPFCYGKGCLGWNPSLCLSACIFVLFSSPFPFWDPLTWGVWNHSPSPFTTAENTVWSHRFYFRIWGFHYTWGLPNPTHQPAKLAKHVTGGLSYFAQPGS